MIVLGIDPGIAITGYGLVRDENRPQMLRCGSIRTDPARSPAERLQRIYTEMSEVIQRERPDAVALEELFFNRNVKTALAVGEARGVVIVAAANLGVTVAEYTPLQVKQAVAGYGRADKVQIQRMVVMLLGLKEVPSPDDVTDALAVGICHLHSARLMAELGGRMGR